MFLDPALVEHLEKSFGKAIENVGRRLNRGSSDSDQIDLIKMLLSQYELEKEKEKEKEREEKEKKKKKFFQIVLSFITCLMTLAISAKNKFLIIIKNADNFFNILIVIQLAIFLNGLKNLLEMGLNINDLFDWLSFNRNSGTIIIVFLQ
jgi:hypothetical protein